jgi:uncharacterized protein YkwD/uncharacterized membrane protein required for colicin V production
MNWVDAVIIAAVILSAYRGTLRGLLLSSLDLIILILSFTVAFGIYRPFGHLFEDMGLSHRSANTLGFLIVWLAVEWLGTFAAHRAYKRIPPEILKARWERLGGSLPSAAEGLLLIALVLTLVIVFPSGRLPKQPVLRSLLGRSLVEVAYRSESLLAVRLGGSFDEAMTFYTTRPGDSETVDLNFQTEQVEADTAAEEQMLKLVNMERRKRHVPSLRMDERLRIAATRHGIDMFRRGFFGHVNPQKVTPADRIKAVGIEVAETGENIALAPTVYIAHDGLMKSPTHRENVLSPGFSRVGIAAIDSRVFGTIFVQDFASD